MDLMGKNVLVTGSNRGIGYETPQIYASTNIWWYLLFSMFEELRCRHGLVGQIGVTTAGMDGPALMGLPTLYLTQERNVRLGKWVGAVPGYQEVVREPGYFEIIRTTLHHWQQ